VLLWTGKNGRDGGDDGAAAVPQVERGWQGEATDFTALLAEQVDAPWTAISVDLIESVALKSRQPAAVASTSWLRPGTAPSSSSSASTDVPITITRRESSRMRWPDGPGPGRGD
jgi:hypothetical protein